MTFDYWSCMPPATESEWLCQFGDVFINIIPLYDAGSPTTACSAQCEVRVHSSVWRTDWVLQLGTGAVRQLVVTVLPSACSTPPAEDTPSSQNNVAALYEFLGADGLDSSRALPGSSPVRNHTSHTA